MDIRFTPGEINVICTDLERSLSFYQDVLGFEVVEREGPAAVHMRCGDLPFLLLAVSGSPLPSVSYGDIPTISFDLIVQDITETVLHLQSCAVVFESLWRPGDSHVFIKDPDGLVIEVIKDNN